MKELKKSTIKFIVWVFVGSIFYPVPVNAKESSGSANHVLDAMECFFDPGIVMKRCHYAPSKVCDESLEELCPIRE